MNAITPANEIPPAQSTAAKGAFPTEQTNESTATIGPSTTFSASRSGQEAPVMNSELKKSIGSSEMNPAIRKPARIARQRTATPPREEAAPAHQACSEATRPRHGSREPALAP